MKVNEFDYTTPQETRLFAMENEYSITLNTTHPLQSIIHFSTTLPLQSLITEHVN
jgi:hypothetical protein